MINKNKKSKSIIGIILAILIGLVAWSMVNVMGSKKKSDENKHLGIAEYEKGNYQEALKHYNNGIKITPDDACLLNNRGLACYSLEQYDKAVADYTRAIELSPDFADAYHNRGLAYFRKGSSYNLEPRKKAIDDFTRAIELKPDCADAYYNRAVIYTEQIHYHHKYGTIPPKFPSKDMDNYNKALADYTRALDIDTSYILAHNGLGNLFYRHGDWDLATREYNKALAQQEEILKKGGDVALAGVFNSRGRNLLAAGKLDQAISDFTRAVEYYRKGVVNKEVGLSKNVTNALAHRTVAAWESGRWEDTIRFADETIEVKEQNPKKYGKSTFYYFTKGRCCYKLARYDEAIDYLEKALEEAKYGMDAKARLWMGRAYKEKGDRQKAKQLIEKAFELCDKNVRKANELKAYKAYIQRGLCYLELDEFDKAISDFQETIKWKVFADKPVNHVNYYLDAHKFIGIAYMKAGDKNKAKEYFEKTIELAKNRGFDEVAKEAEALLVTL